MFGKRFAANGVSSCGRIVLQMESIIKFVRDCVRKRVCSRRGFNIVLQCAVFVCRLRRRQKSWNFPVF